MCGIAGIVNLNREPLGESILKAMAGRQRHRGPDDSGVYVNGPAGLSHVRLSIIDLSKAAHQPMSNEDGTAFIVHNGEIYNYIELKKELEDIGHYFKSKSDTEVILHAYEEWGERCLRRFNGMWSFAVLDLKDKTLFCSRDRFGVKPFYYYSDKNVFIFASEIKSLLIHPAVERSPNDNSIYDYLASGYGYMDISEDTFFKGIKQLMPASYMKLSVETGILTQSRYWDLDPKRRISGNGEEAISKGFYDLFEDAVRLRLRSDVRVGISLSGGLDSSSIACVASRLVAPQRLDTFSSCFDEAEYDERDFIRPVLDIMGSTPNFIFTKPDRLFDEIEEIIWHQDEPYSTLSILPQWHVMKLAREKGVKVLLTGQGGDETLGGYHKYYLYLFADLINSLHWGSAMREIREYKKLREENGKVSGPIARILLSYAVPAGIKNAAAWASRRQMPEYLNADFVRGAISRAAISRRFDSILNNDLYNALKVSPLPSLLHIDDRSSMAHSVESRSPFLDYRLVEYLFSLGPQYKIKDGLTKYILRISLKGILPESVRMRRDKMGFVTPLEKWLKTLLKDKVLDIFNSREFSARPYFNQSKVVKAFKDFIEGNAKYDHYAVWSWLNLELWFRKFMDER